MDREGILVKRQDYRKNNPVLRHCTNERMCKVEYPLRKKKKYLWQSSLLFQPKLLCRSLKSVVQIGITIAIVNLKPDLTKSPCTKDM